MKMVSKVWKQRCQQLLCKIFWNNQQYHQKVKHDCNEDKVGDLILPSSKIITIYFAFIFMLELAYSVLKQIIKEFAIMIKQIL